MMRCSMAAKCLNVNQFTSMDDARRKIEVWRRDYNDMRPHSSLRNLAPREFASKVGKRGSKKAAISCCELSQNGANVENAGIQGMARPTAWGTLMMAI